MESGVFDVWGDSTCPGTVAQTGFAIEPFRSVQRPFSGMMSALATKEDRAAVRIVVPIFFAGF